jgi:hypothetical protein
MSNDHALAALALMPRALRLPLDVNGNPRYYLPLYLFPKMDNKTRSKLGLVKYRGKQYGAGYVIQSYNLKQDLTFICEALDV